jgi:hypothetical protein
MYFVFNVPVASSIGDVGMRSKRGHKALEMMSLMPFLAFPGSERSQDPELDGQDMVSTGRFKFQGFQRVPCKLLKFFTHDLL